MGRDHLVDHNLLSSLSSSYSSSRYERSQHHVHRDNFSEGFAGGSDMATIHAIAIANERANQMHLDFDILLFVGRLIVERKDLLSFISTCSDLYRTGVPTLLGFPCHITSRNLAAFHAFLVSKSPASFLGLRDLTLFLPEGPDAGPDTTMITNILSRAKKLRRIVIYGSVMKPDPAIYRALVALRLLEDLDLQSCSDSKAILTRLQSPVRRLLLNFSDKEDDIVAMLSNFSQTLEDLAVYRIALCKTSLSDLRYRNVTSLMLAFVPKLQLSILIPAFPNLERLDVNSVNHCPDPEIETWHADNLLFQQEHPDQKWRLSSLEGDVASLYAFGLQTAVPTVIVTGLEVEDVEDSGLLKTVLTPLRPLSLSVTPGPYLPVFEMDWLSEEVADGCCELVRLDLELAIENVKPVYLHQRRVDDLFEELSVLSEAHPNLALLYLDIADEDCIGLAAPPFVETLNMRQLAIRARRAIPTLKMSKIMLDPTDDIDSTSYWIYQDDGKLIEIPEEGHDAAEDEFKKKTKSLIEEALSKRRPGSQFVMDNSE